MYGESVTMTTVPCCHGSIVTMATLYHSNITHNAFVHTDTHAYTHTHIHA